MERGEDGFDPRTGLPLNKPPTRSRFIRGTKPPEPAKEPEPDIPILLNPPEKNIFATVVRGTLRRRVRDIMRAESDSFDSPLICSPIKETICETLAEIEAATDWYKEELSQFLYDTGTEFSNHGWIRDNGKIRANLSKRRNCGLLPMMEFLAETQIPFLLSRRYRKIEIEGKMEYRVLVRPDIPGISKRINRAESQVIKYITGAVRAGFLRRFGTKHRGSFLVLGYHDFYKDKEGQPKRCPIYFLKDTPEIREALRTFRRPD